MDTAVLVFEKEETICLTTLKDLVLGSPFAIRIFPLLVHDKKIVKRWALVETEQERRFVEKEERIPTVEEFTETLKGSTCTVAVNTTNRLHIPMYFVISTDNMTLSLCVKQLCVSTDRVASIYEGITKSVLVFFNKKKVVLQGIRVKNSHGKKETIDTAVYMEGPPHRVPETMEMVHTKAHGVEVGRSLCHVQSRILQRIVQKTPLVFSDATRQMYLRLESPPESGGKVFATAVKSPAQVSIIDAAQEYMKNAQVQRFLQGIVQKYGDKIEGITTMFASKEGKGTRGVFDPNVLSALGVSHEEKYQVLSGVLEILNTLRFHPGDRRVGLLESLKTVYAEEIKLLKKDGVKMGGTLLLSPAAIPTGTSSLHYLIREKREISQSINEKSAKNLSFFSLR